MGMNQLLQTMQITLHTLHEHIGSSLIITDYTSNTAYPSRTHWPMCSWRVRSVTCIVCNNGDEPMCSWRVCSVICIVCNNGGWTNVHPPLLQTMQITLHTLHEHIGSSPLLQTMQVTLLTLHEHIGSSPIITDYKWHCLSFTNIVCNNGGWTDMFVKGKQCYLHSL
jgi:succinate dehydrogenase hydrophobic anchor subunit